MMNKIKNKVLYTICALLISCIIGYLLLVLSYALPSGEIEKHIKESVAIFINEGTYFNTSSGFSYTTQQDGWTDALILTNASYNDNTSAFIKAINVPRLQHKDTGKVDNLIALFQDTGGGILI